MQEITFQPRVSSTGISAELPEQLGSCHRDVNDALKELYLLILTMKLTPENEHSLAASILLHFPKEEDS